jgi:hypothetical protein
MMAAGEYLLGTINSVLDMSRIEADQLELHPARIELTELVRACLDVVRPTADAKGVALVLASAAPRRLFADPTRLRQVLVNLLGNAVKFTPAGSVEVRLLPMEGGQSIRVEVVDTGPGIWPRHRDKLFQTFERLNAEAMSGIEGAGLGLALSARLVRAMGGRIGYDDNPAGGSIFWLELPCGAADLAESPADLGNVHAGCDDPVRLVGAAAQQSACGVTDRQVARQRLQQQRRPERLGEIRRRTDPCGGRFCILSRERIAMGVCALPGNLRIRSHASSPFSRGILRSRMIRAA